MINDPFHPEEAVAREKESSRRMLLAIVCAVGLSAVLLVSYGYMRRRHGKQVLANASVPVADNGLPKGPPVAHVQMDEPLLEKGVTVFSGKIKNISNRDLTGLSVSLDLIRRKDGSVEPRAIAVQPSSLQPQAEALYSVRLSAQEYGSIRFVGLKADPEATLIAYSSSPGKKRPPERIEPKVVVVKRGGKPGEFINSPDNPVRVP